jgi:hypothetical protein
VDGSEVRAVGMNVITDAEVIALQAAEQLERLPSRDGHWVHLDIWRDPP